jgi:aspartate ammonia-lyase
MVIQAAYRVMAHDHEVSLVVMSGELELNAFLPLAADALLDTLDLLRRTDMAFAERCVKGITARVDRCRRIREKSHEIITALIPRIGHEKAVEVARLMRDRNLPVRDAVRETGCLPDGELDEWLSPERLCALGWK